MKTCKTAGIILAYKRDMDINNDEWIEIAEKKMAVFHSPFKYLLSKCLLLETIIEWKFQWKKYFWTAFEILNGIKKKCRIHIIYYTNNFHEFIM